MNKVSIATALALMIFALNMKAQNFPADLTTPRVISSNMVLQREQAVTLWGKAVGNEPIVVVFGSQSVNAVADSTGKWTATLQPMKADKTPKQLTIRGNKTNIIYENILVGEVWLCSGQSNMQYGMKRYHTFLPPERGEDIEALERQKPANEMIRVYVSDWEQSWKSWKVADGKSIEDVSSVGYFFGKAIQEKLDVPVGIITVAIGGARIETWTPKEAYEQSAFFAHEIKKEGKIDGMEPANLYNQLLVPVIPYTVKGFLWYQGENNCGIGDRRYAEKYQLLVNTWRDVFKLPDAPVYSVLLAPYYYSSKLHRGGPPLTSEELPIFREQQKRGTTLVSNSEYIVISDLIDDWKDIHPPYKWEVGARLARLALAKTYGFNEIVWSGPRIHKIETVADSVLISFDHCAAGLKTNNERRVNWFEIAAKDGVFRPALADIKDKNKLVVYHPDIKQPAKIRLSWHEIAAPNLVNSDGIPAVPFCFDIK